MTTKKAIAPAVGAHIENVHIENKAAPCGKDQSKALKELARAAIANAQAISDIAKALKGADAHMTNGIYLSDVTGSR